MRILSLTLLLLAFMSTPALADWCPPGISNPDYREATQSDYCEITPRYRMLRTRAVVYLPGNTEVLTLKVNGRSADYRTLGERLYFKARSGQRVYLKTGSYGTLRFRLKG